MSCARCSSVTSRATSCLLARGTRARSSRPLIGAKTRSPVDHTGCRPSRRLGVRPGPPRWLPRRQAAQCDHPFCRPRIFFCVGRCCGGHCVPAGGHVRFVALVNSAAKVNSGYWSSARPTTLSISESSAASALLEFGPLEALIHTRGMPPSRACSIHLRLRREPCKIVVSYFGAAHRETMTKARRAPVAYFG